MLVIGRGTQRAEWEGWREALGGRAERKKKEGETEKEVDLLEVFFYYIHEFLTVRHVVRNPSVSSPVISH